LNHAQESPRVAQGAFPQLFAFGLRGARHAFECLSRIKALTPRPLGEREKMFRGLSQGRQRAPLRQIGLDIPGRLSKTVRKTRVSIASVPNLPDDVRSRV
jgi:hypothetical protein